MTQWPDVLSTLIAREDLQPDQARAAMESILEGEATAAQIAAFAVALRAKGETPAEVEALLAVMLERSTPVPVDGPVLDVVGTGGDRSHSVNISTASAIIVAAAGARVVKHGNKAASSQCGSADVLEALGVKIGLPADDVAACLDEVGLGFCFAPIFHPALRHAAAPRREIGVATVFNILGPLANPARPAAALIGVSYLPLVPVMTGVLQDAGVRAIVVRGQDGLDEIGLDGPTSVWETGSEEIVASEITPETFGLPRAPISALRGGDAATNARLLTELLAGQPGPIRDTVLANAAAAWAAWAALTDDAPLAARLADGLQRVTEAVDSGRAADLLSRWVAFSQSRSV